MASIEEAMLADVAASLEALLGLVYRGEVSADLPAEKGMIRQIRGALTVLDTVLSDHV